MAFKRELISLICFINLASYCLSDQSYSIEIGKLVLSPATDPTWFTDYTLRTSKVAKNTFAVSGGYEQLKNMGNDIQWTVAIYKKDQLSGKFLATPTYISTSTPCKLYDELKFVDDLIAASNLPPKGTCPLPKAHYVIKNYTVTPDALPGFILPGEYKIMLSVMKEQNLVGAIELFINVIRE